MRQIKTLKANAFLVIFILSMTFSVITSVKSTATMRPCTKKEMGIKKTRCYGEGSHCTKVKGDC
jgi:hypothetical protein